MQQVIRRKVVVESDGRIQVRAAGLRKGTRAEVLIIVEAKSGHTPSAKGDRSALHDSIAAYAANYSGTDSDLEPALEADGVEFLTNETRGTRR